MRRSLLFDVFCGGLIALLCSGCAQIISPSGGPVDKTAPGIVRAHPNNYSTAYQGNEVRITFDEFVQLSGLQKQLVVTPLPNTPPTLTLRKKTLSIQFTEDLLDNTTYSLFLGNGVVDITERNPLDSNTFVFSTGQFLDSASLIGQVNQAFSLTPQKGVIVMLYDTLGDSVPMKKRPTYIGKTNEMGEFSINNAKPGIYQLFALEDLNANYLFDQPSERIAFAHDTIELRRQRSVSLRLFKEAAKRQFLKKHAVYGRERIEFIFHRPSPSTYVQLTNYTFKKPWYRMERSASEDTLTYWLEDLGHIDSLRLQVWDEDVILDTLEVTLPKPEEKRRKKEILAFTHSSGMQTGEVPFFEPLRMVFSKPIQQVFKDKMWLVSGQDSLPVDWLADTDLQRHWHVKTSSLQPSTPYQFTALSGAFISVFGDSSKAMSMTFSTDSEEDYGSLSLSVHRQNDSKPMILEVFKNDKRVRSRPIRPAEEITLDNLPVGTYRMKLIYDEDGNGQWNTGEYATRRQPEKVLFYQEEIVVRSGWELDLKWQLAP